MAQIEIPTYKSIVENELFGKKAKPFKHHVLGQTDATQLARLTKFRVPTQEEVIDFIVKSAKIVEIRSVSKSKPENKSVTSSYLKSLPGFGISGIAAGDNDDIKHLRSHYGRSGFQEGHTYLESMNGVVPNEILDMARRLFKEEGIEVYERAIEGMGSDKWNLRIRFLENGKLPDISEIEYLMDRGVRESNVLLAGGDVGDYQCVVNHIRLLYNSLKSPELLSKVVDASPRFLDHKSATTVQKVVGCYTEEKAISGLAGILGHVVEEIEKREKQQPKKGFFDIGPQEGDPSLN